MKHPFPSLSRALPILSLLSALLAPCTHAAADTENTTWSMDQLMNTLAQVPSAHASFVETKTIAILQKPVESSGELFYSAPNRLEKRTLLPKPESMLLDGPSLTIEQGRKKQVLNLRQYPEIAAFIDSIRGTLAGDRNALERNYQLSLQGNAQGWTLELLPMADRMKKVVASIRISGERDELRTITIQHADGDSSIMAITRIP